MRALCIGDVFAPSGVKMLLDNLGKVKRQYGIDLCIVNGENSAVGNGITKETADLIFSAGADVIPGGNHTLRHPDFLQNLDLNPCLLRPDNIKSDFGSGYCLYDMGKYSAAIINLSGQIFLEKLEADNPFVCADLLINRAKEDGARCILVDFHAAVTSEKRALGFYLDGRVSAVFGTHTHIQTADIQVLPLKTGYVTDLGMTGVTDSVLGVKKEIIIERLRVKDQHKFEAATGKCHMSGCVFEFDDNTGLCRYAENIYTEQKEII